MTDWEKEDTISRTTDAVIANQRANYWLMVANFVGVVALATYLSNTFAWSASRIEVNLADNEKSQAASTIEKNKTPSVLNQELERARQIRMIQNGEDSNYFTLPVLGVRIDQSDLVWWAPLAMAVVLFWRLSKLRAENRAVVYVVHSVKDVFQLPNTGIPSSSDSLALRATYVCHAISKGYTYSTNSEKRHRAGSIFWFEPDGSVRLENTWLGMNSGRWMVINRWTPVVMVSIICGVDIWYDFTKRYNDNRDSLWKIYLAAQKQSQVLWRDLLGIALVFLCLWLTKCALKWETRTTNCSQSLAVALEKKGISPSIGAGLVSLPPPRRKWRLARRRRQSSPEPTAGGTRA